MEDEYFHMRFRDVVSVNLLFAALDKSFPLFRSVGSNEVVESSGKTDRERVFLTLKEFSTSFPQNTVEAEH